MLKLVLAMTIMANAFSFTVKTKVIQVEDNENEKSLDVLVRYDGRIFTVKRDNLEVIEKLEAAKEIGAEVELDLSTDFVSSKILGKLEVVKDVRLLSTEASADESVIVNQDTRVGPADNYEPTDLVTFDRANSVFKDLRNVGRMQKNSQCFNRAYLWSKHMYDTQRIKSMKILIYYSRKYRKNIRGSKWWFHIAPMVKVGNEFYAMDYKFRKKPETALDWENYFTAKIPNKDYDCMRMNHYSEFQKNYDNRNEWCMIQYTSMYYWEPNDIERVEKTGVPETRFQDYRVKEAAREAFRRWRGVYNKYRI